MHTNDYVPVHIRGIMPSKNYDEVYKRITDILKEGIALWCVAKRA
jgi:hypothetical protein